MKNPRMILFDYGETLINLAPFDGIAAAREMMKHVKHNPHGITVEQLYEKSDLIFKDMQRHRDHGFEPHNHTMLRLTFESLGLEFDMPLDNIEQIQFDFGAPGSVTPHASQMLDYINTHGYRSGVISNIGFSGESLTRQLHMLLPNNRFEFIIASSEYGVRKPDPAIFQLALCKANLSPEEVWFCGDSPRFDIAGAASSGIFPIWYRGGNVGDVQHAEPHDLPKHIMIGDWMELIDLLETSGGSFL